MNQLLFVCIDWLHMTRKRVETLPARNEWYKPDEKGSTCKQDPLGNFRLFWTHGAWPLALSSTLMIAGTSYHLHPEGIQRNGINFIW